MFEQLGLAPHCPLDHAIDLEDKNAPPPRHKQYQLSVNELGVVQNHVNEMLKKGWICPCILPYSVPILFVCYKMGELHMCINCSSLNYQTWLDMFPMSHIHDLLDKLSKSFVFSAIDLSSAYH